MKNRPVHFEIQADDVERAADFYRQVFGWEIKKWEDPSMEYWMIMTAPTDFATGQATDGSLGINGGLLKRPCPAPAPNQGTNAFVCTMEVDNYDEIAEKIISAGGKEAMPKFTIADMAYQGYFIDTEGNTFGLHQRISK